MKNLIIDNNVGAIDLSTVMHIDIKKRKKSANDKFCSEEGHHSQSK